MAVETGSPSRRAPVTRERVLRAAVELADRDGIEALSMRRLGQEIGIEAMSLYNHVANKDDLLDGVVELVVGEIEPPVSGTDWKSTMRQRVLSARQTLVEHRWAAEVIAARPNMTPAVLAYMDSMAAILRNGGFSVDLTHHAFHVMGSRIIGFAQELYDDSGPPPEDSEAAQMMLSQMLAKYPSISEIAAQVAHDDATTVGSGCDDQFEFEFGLDLILDGLERLRQAQTISGHGAAHESA